MWTTASVWLQMWWCLVIKSCPTLCNPMDCSPPDSSVHEISQARILEWVTTSYSRDSSRTRDQTHISCVGRRILYHWATKETPWLWMHEQNLMTPKEDQVCSSDTSKVVERENIKIGASLWESNYSYFIVFTYVWYHLCSQDLFRSQSTLRLHTLAETIFAPLRIWMKNMLKSEWDVTLR